MHTRQSLLRSAAPLPYEMKEGDDPTAAVTAALAEFKSAFDTRLAALEAKGIDPKLIERLDRIEARAQRPGGGTEEPKEPGIERKAFASYLRYGDRTPVEELKTLTVSSDPQGGFIAPNEISTEIVRDITALSPIRQLATVRTTSSPGVTYPKRTGITNAKWKGETQTQEGSEPSFGQVDIPVREINTFVDISNQLLLDATSAEAEIRLALAEDFGAKEGLAFTKGAGPLQPEGLMTATGVSYTPTGNGSTLGSAPADVLIDCYYAVPAGYRARGVWIMNAKTLASIRKLKDSVTGSYIWQPSLAAGQPETILGKAVYEVPDMADVGSAAEPIAFGDFLRAYRIVDRIDLSILVNPFLLATQGTTRIHATRRVGGAVVQPNAFRKVRCASS